MQAASLEILKVSLKFNLGAAVGDYSGSLSGTFCAGHNHGHKPQKLATTKDGRGNVYNGISPQFCDPTHDQYLHETSVHC